VRTRCTGFEIVDEEIKLHADKYVEQHKERLHDEASALGSVWCRAVDLFVPGGRRFGGRR